MSIENREVAVGTRLVARHKKQDRTCEVVETPDGLRYRLDDATEHRSPSSAGKAAMEGVACNGWRFWSVEGTEPKTKAEKPAKAKMEPAAKKPAKAAKKGKSAKKSKAAKMASDASYGCGVCPETFPTLKKATAHAMMHTA
jgi:leucyl aminopeptidase (aminopeptidase T)